MNYIEYILIFGFFLLVIGNIFYFLHRVRCDHFTKMVIKAMLKKQKASINERYFNTLVLQKIVRFLIKKRTKKAKTALLYLCLGRQSLAQNYLRAFKRPYWAALLEAHQKPEKALPLLEELIKSDPTNYDILSELAVLYFIQEKLPKAKLILAKIDDKKASSYALAKKYFYQSFFFIKDGDMLSASENCSLAIKLFNKNKAYIEEAESYVLTGTIYRLSCVEDVAQFMFETATKIFAQWGDEIGIAEVLGNMGMLMVLQERFGEAKDNFDKALIINQKLQRNEATADIYNQLALMNILQNKLLEAKELVQKALRLDNKPREAFSCELQAHIDYKQRNFTDSAVSALRARNLYKATPNLSAYFESMYMEALARFELGELDTAEKILREIITISKKKSSAFHVANAYNLLGLIFLKNNDLQRAKVWFQESVALEQKNDRLSGAATDYANIGMIELQCGQVEQARKNMVLALEYAKAYGETELSQILEAKLDKLET